MPKFNLKYYWKHSLISQILIPINNDLEIEHICINKNSKWFLNLRKIDVIEKILYITYMSWLVII